MSKETMNAIEQGLILKNEVADYVESEQDVDALIQEVEEELNNNK